ncbi:MAG: sigma-70 family RNA polymerase sigma factor [Planctomycetes bacterium]|nr:sigma-70 family RNA polymerase sigma factor [Planctomycetota bacterium]
MSEQEAEDGRREAAPDFERLLDQNLPALRAFVRLRTSSKLRQLESHVDLVQSVCREALQARHGLEYRGDTEFRNWLFTFAKRKLVERDRYWNSGKRDIKRKVDERPAADGDRDWNLVDQYATFTTPSMHARSKEELERVEAAFDRLTEEQREVLTLVRVGGLSHADAAAVMGCTEENSRQLLRRALVRLSIILEEDG